jgi:hypothetical protein
MRGAAYLRDVYSRHGAGKVLFVCEHEQRSPAKIVEYDKATAAVLATEQLNMNLTNAFAFAFYAGDFFLFTESNQNASVSKVTHYNYDDDKALTNVVNQAPIRIVGAGVSTCAPVLPQ